MQAVILLTRESQSGAGRPAPSMVKLYLRSNHTNISSNDGGLVMRYRTLTLLLIACLALPVGACTNMTKTQQGAVSGGLIGAGAGAGISALAGGSAGVGAAIGGALGGVVGGLYGHDQSKK